MVDHPPIIRQMYASNGLKFIDGNVVILGWNAMIFPMNTIDLLTKTMIDKFGKEAQDIFYNIGKIQGTKAQELFLKQYGHKKSKNELIKYLVQQSWLIGTGIEEIIRFDDKNNVVIIAGINNPFATQYRLLFGIQKEAVDHFKRGILSGALSVILKKNMVVIETKCIAKGDVNCIFEAREKDKWDMKENKFLNQFPKELDNFEILNKKNNLKTLKSRN